MADAWDPDRYARYRAERARPFHDLLALVRPAPGGRLVDLGCGTGELTALAHATLGTATALGLDASPAMLERAPAGVPGLRFAPGEIADLELPAGSVDVLLANASLQWVDDHPALLARLVPLLAPGGQLAFQVPANHGHPSHVLAAELAAEEPFADALGGYVRRSPVLEPAAYALLAARLGLVDVRCRLEIYLHPLADGADGVVEWVRGTLLTAYLGRLPEELREPFLARYRERLAATLGDARPYLYAFPRILLAGTRG